MSGWTPTSRTGSPQRRLGVMAALVGAAALAYGAIETAFHDANPC